MYSFREAVNNCEYCSITFGETGDNMGLQLGTRVSEAQVKGEAVQPELDGRLYHGRREGRNKTSICEHGRPPETLLKESQDSVEPRVAGNPRGMSPLEHLRSNRFKDQQSIRWASWT